MSSRLTVYLPDAAYGEVQRRVDAGEAPAMSAWIAAAVGRALDAPDPGNGEEVAALREQLADALAEGERQRGRADAAEAQCRTVEEERDAAREQCHALDVRCAAAEARCEERASTVASTAALVEEVRGERSVVLAERKEVQEAQRRNAAVAEERDAARAQCHDLMILLSAALAWGEAQQVTIQSMTSHVSDLQGERDRLLVVGGAPERVPWWKFWKNRG